LYKLTQVFHIHFGISRGRAMNVTENLSIHVIL